MSVIEPPPRRRLRPDKSTRTTAAEKAREYDRVALVLQGGGALGAYQGGVFEALDEAKCCPDWVAGVSIGAINAALIAGNPPERRLQRLSEFWARISGRKIWPFRVTGDAAREWRNGLSAFMTVMYGQPGFFTPRLPPPWMQPAGSDGSTSFYDSAALRQTLEELVDFELLNDGPVRVSVGAVNVRTGNFIYFDSAEQRLGPEHIMASGALPPALPAVKIDGEFYWDGGIVSNTPLQYLLDMEDRDRTLIFQVDLFSARGAIPRDLADVSERRKDIIFSSRTRYNTDTFRKLHRLRHALKDVLRHVPEERRELMGTKLLNEVLTGPSAVNIVQLIYQQKTYEGHAKDYEFSGTSMKEHWQAGYDDTQRTLRHPEWLDAPRGSEGVVVHDLHRDAHD